MASDALGRLEARLRALREEDARLFQRRAEIDAEIKRIESAADVLREVSPLDYLPTSAYGDLRSMTTAQACAAVLQVAGEPATSRQLLEILAAAGKGRLAPDKPSSLINVIGALKQHPELFRRDGKRWALADWLAAEPPLVVHGEETEPDAPEVSAETVPKAAASMRRTRRQRQSHG